MMLFLAVLSVSNGVGGCEWPIYDRSVCMDVTFWKFSNSPPSSTSMDDAMTFIMKLHSICTILFSRGISVISVLYFGPRKNPPDIMCASGYEM